MNITALGMTMTKDVGWIKGKLKKQQGDTSELQ